jgi:hypothetical protein
MDKIVDVKQHTTNQSINSGILLDNAVLLTPETYQWKFLTQSNKNNVNENVDMSFSAHDGCLE